MMNWKDILAFVLIGIYLSVFHHALKAWDESDDESNGSMLKGIIISALWPILVVIMEISEYFKKR